MFDKKIKQINKICISLTFLLLAYSTIRAYWLSMTVDEGTTFFNLVEERTYSQIIFQESAFGTANNHILNSLLAKLGYQLFGMHVLALRLGSLVAHGFYLFFGYKITILLQKQSVWVALTLFVLLNFNPYLLDFFSLARGYSWSLAATLAGIFYFLQRDFTKAAVAMAIGIFANFSFLHVAAVIWLLFQMRFLMEKRPISEIVRANLPPSVILGFVGVLVLNPILVLKKNGEFLYGEDNLFATYQSVAFNFAYRNPMLANDGVPIMSGIFMVLIGFSIFLGFKKYFSNPPSEQINHHFYLAILPCVSLLLMFVQYQLVGSKYLVNRTALPLYPMIVLSLVPLLSIDNQRIKVGLQIVLLGFFSLHSIRTFNLSQTFEWWVDRYNREIVAYITAQAQHEGHPLSLGTFVSMHPGVFFHVRQSGGWVRMPVWEEQYPRFRTDTYHEFYYLLESQLPEIHPAYQLVLQRGDCVLMRR
jgi:hypothetical protein